MKKDVHYRDILHSAYAELSLLDMSDCTMTARMFYSCSKLARVSCSCWNLNQVEDARYMFCSCANLYATFHNWSLAGSKVTTVKVPKSMVSAYKKIFTKANCGKTVKVRAI